MLSLSRGLDSAAARPRGGAHVATPGQHGLVGTCGPNKDVTHKNPNLGMTHTETDIGKSSAHLSCFTRLDPENTAVLKVHYVDFGTKFSSEEPLFVFMTE